MVNIIIFIYYAKKDDRNKIPITTIKPAVPKTIGVIVATIGDDNIEPIITSDTITVIKIVINVVTDIDVIRPANISNMYIKTSTT